MNSAAPIDCLFCEQKIEHTTDANVEVWRDQSSAYMRFAHKECGKQFKDVGIYVKLERAQ